MTQGIQCPHCYQFHLNNIGESPCICPCHSKVPEKKCCGRWDTTHDMTCPYHKAPTDESWEVSLRRIIKSWRGDFETEIDVEELKSFIASLLQKEREKGRKEWENINKQYLSREEAFEAGKSEAFSLVRKVADKIKYMNHLDKAKVLAAIDELSTLEGK